MEEKEIWKDIPEFEGLYQVSNLGRVRSLDRTIKQWHCRGHKFIERKIPSKIIKPYGKYAKKWIELSKDGKNTVLNINDILSNVGYPLLVFEEKEKGKNLKKWNKQFYLGGKCNALIGQRNFK